MAHPYRVQPQLQDTSVGNTCALGNSRRLQRNIILGANTGLNCHRCRHSWCTGRRLSRIPIVLSQNPRFSDLNLLPPLMHHRRRISVVLGLAVREHRRLGIPAVSLCAGLRTTMRFDRTSSHPNAQNSRRHLSALIRGISYDLSSNLLKCNRQNQHQRSKCPGRTCVPAGRHPGYNEHSKPENTFQAVEDGVGFGACPFAEAVRVLCQHLVGNDEERFEAL